MIATQGELIAKLNDTEEYRWQSDEDFHDDLASIPKHPVIYAGMSAWHTLQPIIVRELQQEAAKAVPHLLPSSIIRQRVLALAGLDTRNARHVNFCAWALAKTVQAETVVRYEVSGPRGGKRYLYHAPLPSDATGAGVSAWPEAKQRPNKERGPGKGGGASAVEPRT